MRLRVNTPDVMHETIDGEVIAIHLASGNYYSLRGTGADIWALLTETPATREEIVEALASGFQDSRADIESAVASFLDQLGDEGLVTDARESQGEAGPRAASSPNGVPRRAFEVPRFEKHSDMQDLVLLDPVHQVDDTGWPRARPDAAENA